MADNETSYLPIGTCLEQIKQAVYGREVRKAIHDGIAQCYDDTVEGVNAAQQAASDTQEVIDNAVIATREANTAATEASRVKVEQTVSGDTVTFTTTKRDGTTVSTSFQKPNVVVSKDEGSGEFSVTGIGWNGEEIIATIPDPSEEVKSRATIAAVSRVKTALGNPLTITDGMDAPAVKTVVTLEPKQDLHGYDHPWVGGAGKNLLPQYETGGSRDGLTWVVKNDGRVVINGTATATVTIDAPRSTWMWDGVTDCWLSGCPAGGNATTGYHLRIDVPNSVSIYSKPDIGAGVKFESQSSTGSVANSVLFFRIVVRSGTVCNNLTFAPQLEIGSTVTSYEPYSNICPIEGYDNVRVTATGKNLAVKAPASLNTNIYNATNLIPVKAGETIYTYALFTSTSTTNMQAKIFSTKDVISKTANVVKDLGTFVSGAAAFFAITNDGYLGVTYYAGVSSYTIDKMIISREPIVNPDEFADPNTTSLSVAQAAGATVYGGTVTLNEDGSGTLVVDKGYVDLGSLTWTKNESSGNTFYQAGDIAATIKKPAATDVVIPLVSDLFNATYAGASFYHYAEGISVHTNGTLRLYYASQPATESELKTFLSGHQLVYPLATVSTSYTLTASQLRTLTGENHVWTDGTKLELTYRADKYADVEKFLNAIPTGTKTGDPAVFTDGADDLPFEKLTIAVEPHQEGSGDPSPDNVRPITGWDEVKVTRCGKNKLGIRGTWDANGNPVGANNGIRTELLDVTPGQICTAYKDIALTGGSYNMMVRKFDTSGTFVGSSVLLGYDSVGFVQWTVPTDVYKIGVVQFIDPSFDMSTIKLMFATEVATSYEPYASTTLPISLKYATGSTVYGGTVTINRDGTGSVVVDKYQVILDGVKNKVNVFNSGTANYMYRFSSGVEYTGNVTTGRPLYCNQYTFQGNGVGSTNTTQGISVVTDGTIRIRDGEEMSADAFNARLAANPVQVVFNMATPITYTLTAPQLTTLLGNNTVWCDAGQVTVKYKRDIGKMISNLYAMLIDTGAIVIENEEDVTVEGPGYP